MLETQNENVMAKTQYKKLSCCCDSRLYRTLWMTYLNAVSKLYLSREHQIPRCN